jgi:hypothetical protein
MDTPIVEFEIVKLYMSYQSLLFAVLKAAYEHQTLDLFFYFEAHSEFKTSAPLSYIKTMLLNPSSNTTQYHPSLSTEVASKLTSAHSTVTENGSRLPKPNLGDRSLNPIQSVWASTSHMLGLYYFDYRALTVTMWSAKELFSALHSCVNVFSTEVASVTSSISTNLSLLLKNDTYSLGSSPSIDTAYNVINPNYAPDSASLQYSLLENPLDSRFARSMNAVFKYDFKVGNYMTDDMKKMNPHLFMTIKDITTGLRKSS